MGEISNELVSEYSEDGFWMKLTRYAKVAGVGVVERSLWLYYAAQRPDTPAWAKGIIYGALGYFILPLDSIPDLTPFVGFADDLGALAVALATIASYVDDDIKQRAREKMARWFGEREAVAALLPPPASGGSAPE